MHNALYLKSKMLFFVLGLVAGFYNPSTIKYLVAINIALAVAEGARERLLLNALLGLVVLYICMKINWKTTDMKEILSFLIPFIIWNVWFSVSSKDDPLSALAHNLIPFAVALATLKMTSIPENALWNWGLVRVSMLIMLFIHGASPWAGCPTSK
jgi:hypothetical protein